MDDMRAGGPDKFFDFFKNENPMTVMQDIMDEAPGEFDKSMNQLAETNPMPDSGDGFFDNVLDGISFLAGKAIGIGKSIAKDVSDMAKSAIKVGQSAINYVHHGVYEDAEQYTSRQQKLAALKKITDDMKSGFSKDSRVETNKKKAAAQQLLSELSGMKHEKGTEGLFNEVTSAITDISAKQEAIDNRRAEQQNSTPMFDSYRKVIEAFGGPSTRATKNFDLERTGQLSDSIQKVDEHALALNPGYQYWDENGNSKLLVAFDSDDRELFNPKPGLVAYYKDVSREMKDGKITLGESNTLTPTEAQSIMSNNKDSYEGWATYCNFVAGMVSENQGGPNLQQLNGVPQNANSMYDNLLNGRYDTDSYQLLEVPYTMAKLHASNGGFAAGSWKNPEVGRSGHIVVLTGGYGDDGKPTSGNLNIYQGGSKYGNMLLKDGMSESKRNSTKYYILKNRNESWSSLWY